MFNEKNIQNMFNYYYIIFYTHILITVLCM
jgi:hypothetical protein